MGYKNIAYLSVAILQQADMLDLTPGTEIILCDDILYILSLKCVNPSEGALDLRTDSNKLEISAQLAPALSAFYTIYNLF